jgi:hypothetical protein
MNDEDRKEEEVDVTPFEGEPDFEDAPSHNTVEEVQDADDIDPVEGGQVTADSPAVEGLVLDSGPTSANVPGASPATSRQGRVPGTPRA